VCLAVVASTGAYTQVPPDPNNPLEAVPDPVTFTPYGEPISLENAKKVAAAAAAEVAKRNWRGAFCISVADTSGELVYFERGENCQFASIAISQHKARTAARYRRPTGGVRTTPICQRSMILPARAAVIRSLSVARSLARLG
jgi:hypothetical protein